jgi:hypothetical protein
MHRTTRPLHPTVYVSRMDSSRSMGSSYHHGHVWNEFSELGHAHETRRWKSGKPV